jgi:hypothetical protein
MISFDKPGGTVFYKISSMDRRTFSAGSFDGVKLSLDLTGFHKGIYLMEIRNNDGAGCIKIIKE